jgi:hypothetical protein
MTMLEPEASMMPPATEDQRFPHSATTSRALTNAAACIAEHGATPEQAEAMREITRVVIESGDPTGAARQVLDLIEAQKAAADLAAALTAEQVTA